MIRRVLLAVTLLTVAVPATASQAAAADGCSSSSYWCDIRTSTDVVTASVGADGRSDSPNADGCGGCSWAVAPACAGNDPGHQRDSLCERATQCAVGRLYRIYQRPPGQPWRPVGTQCLGGDAAQAARLAAGLRAEAERRYGPGTPSYQPITGAVINLPVLFAAGQPRTHTYRLTLLGQQLTLTGTATWHWDFGDGTTLTTTNPGGPYPDTSLNHTYTRPGTYTVQLTTTWQASYAFNTTAIQPVPGPPLHASAPPIVITIGQARSQLTGN